jgi:Phosphoesterase family
MYGRVKRGTMLARREVRIKLTDAHIRQTYWYRLGLLLILICSLPACSERSATNPIQHTVFILKENHTFDNYFGTFSGADGVSGGITSMGRKVPLTPMPDAYQSGLCNSWDCAIEAIDAGRMDRFDLISPGLDAYVQAPSKMSLIIGHTRAGSFWPTDISPPSTGPACRITCSPSPRSRVE